MHAHLQKKRYDNDFAGALPDAGVDSLHKVRFHVLQKRGCNDSKIPPPSYIGRNPLRCFIGPLGPASVK